MSRPERAAGPAGAPSCASVGVVVVAFGREDLLAAALRPLTGRTGEPGPRPEAPPGSQDFVVVVVDNASSSRCRAVCDDAGVRYDDPGVNLGFAAAVNRGVRLLPPRCDVLLLNPDAVLAAAGLVTLHARLHAPGAERVAAVAPAQRHPDTAEEQRVAWPFPTPARQWAIAAGLGRMVRAEDFLIGSVLLLRREAWDEVGPLDERFFLYAEETDWQRRAVGRGWQVRMVPEVVADHLGAATSPDPVRREAIFLAAGELYVRKWFGARGWARHRAALVAGDAARAVLARGEARAAARRRLPIELRGPLRHRDRLMGGADG